MWVRPHITDEVMPLDVTGADGPITSYTVAVVSYGAPAPTIGYVVAEVDGQAVGPRIQGLPAGTYQAYAKVGTRVLNPVTFRLT